MTKPFFSIVTVTLNNLVGLKKTHESLDSQTHQNFEWIIIDGVSSDGTIEFLNANDIPHFSESDTGIYDAMNKGIIRASGQYTLFLNAGDTLANKNTLQMIQEKTGFKNYNFIYGDSLEEKNKVTTYKRARPHDKISQGMFTHHQAMIYNTNNIQSMAYDTQYQIAADYDFTWRAVQRADEVLYLDEPFCIFEAGGLSQQRVLKGRIEQFKIRHAQNIPLYKNVSIFITQSLAYGLRFICPKLYWILKR